MGKTDWKKIHERASTNSSSKSQHRARAGWCYNRRMLPPPAVGGRAGWKPCLGCRQQQGDGSGSYRSASEPCAWPWELPSSASSCQPLPVLQAVHTDHCHSKGACKICLKRNVGNLNHALFCLVKSWNCGFSLWRKIIHSTSLKLFKLCIMKVTCYYEKKTRKGQNNFSLKWACFHLISFAPSDLPRKIILWEKDRQLHSW